MRKVAVSKQGDVDGAGFVRNGHSRAGVPPLNPRPGSKRIGSRSSAKRACDVMFHTPHDALYFS